MTQDLIDYSKDKKSGMWSELSANKANDIINSIYCPIVAAWHNPTGGSGHVAILYPGYIPQEAEMFDEGEIKIFQAGATEPAVSKMKYGFPNNSAKNRVHYFILKWDYQRYEKFLEENTDKLPMK